MERKLAEKWIIAVFDLIRQEGIETVAENVQKRLQREAGFTFHLDAIESVIAFEASYDRSQLTKPTR